MVEKVEFEISAKCKVEIGIDLEVGCRTPRTTRYDPELTAGLRCLPIAFERKRDVPKARRIAADRDLYLGALSGVGLQSFQTCRNVTGIKHEWASGSVLRTRW
jgi:hypothetical protein